MSSTTLKALLEDFAEEYHQGKLGTTTATGDTTSLIDATRFARPSAGNEFARNSPIRITGRAAVAGGAITIGSEVFLSDFLPSAGDFTTTTMDDTPEIGTSFIVAYPIGSDFSTDRWVEALNRFLTEYADRRMRVPFTFVPNGDYIAAATTGWTAVNASTPAYSELAHPDGYYQRVLVVTSTAGNGYLRSTLLKAVPNDTWNFYTFNRATVAGDEAKLIVRDETNGADITLSLSVGDDTYSGLSFQDLLCTFTIPSGCTQISFRLTSTASGDITHWGPIVAAPQNATTYTGQTALEYLKKVSDLQSFVAGTNGPQERQWFPVAWGGDDDQFGWGQGFTFARSMPFPLFATMLMNYPALTAGDPTGAGSGSAASESDTTACPKPLALAGMAVEFFRWAYRQERLARGPDSAQTRFGSLLEDAQANLIAAQSSWDAPKRIQVRKHFSGHVVA